ncbi:heavy-metal-associated domain-containing protein [Methylohalobius crimeensis]|uniref:heavy-metal-associated domain-containing protein n=1 Tax=Methylohalobius crimeensis TaxID=244365 RepID=UPI0003B3B4BF|nr:heavy-metal-associated domain-containing protein [Methylohalobius crimeensis]
MTKATVSVTGMKCDACENLIHDALMEREGVVEVKADHQAKSVAIDYDENKADLDALKQTIVSQGFKVVGFGEESLFDKIKAYLDNLFKFFKS